MDNKLDALKALIANQTDPSELSSEDRQVEIDLLLSRLKELRKVPRSDWHREFEDALQLDVESWDNGSWVIREHSLGEDAPRTDFIVVSGNGLPPNVKAVFKGFLKNNAIEFKGPGDRLDRLAVRKSTGYANFYIATANPAEDVTETNVTMTIFAAEKHEKQFEELMNEGIVAKTDTSGIYSVHKITDIPFQIVILGELERESYAAYRVLRKHADMADVELLLDELKEADKANNQTKRDRLHRILGLVESKNPGSVAEFIREDSKMRSVFWDVLQPEIDEVLNTAVAEAVETAVKEAVAKEHAETTMNNLFEYVQDGGMTITFAANKAGLTPQNFQAEMIAHGFKVPEMA